MLFVKRPEGKSKRGWKDNTERQIMETVCDEVNSDQLALRHVQWQVLVLAIQRFQILLLVTCSVEMGWVKGKAVPLQA